jgi:hypothetical protein
LLPLPIAKYPLSVPLAATGAIAGKSGGQYSLGCLHDVGDLGRDLHAPFTAVTGAQIPLGTSGYTLAAGLLFVDEPPFGHSRKCRSASTIPTAQWDSVADLEGRTRLYENEGARS